ncbi:MAG: sulfur carrier protein ThiS [Gammaproteobacteria bacterium]
MEITLNGASRSVPEQTSAHDLIQSLGLANKRLALEINREIIPRSTFDQHMIRPGDTIEIVHAIGGG